MKNKNCLLFKIQPFIKSINKKTIFSNYQIIGISISLLSVLLFYRMAFGADYIMNLKGSDFTGGASKMFGDKLNNVSNVNYIYSETNPEVSKMHADFIISAIPLEEMYLHIKGMDDNYAEKCPIEITINDKNVYSGKSEFPDNKWGICSFKIGKNILKNGENRITFLNRSKEGKIGMPPWFALALCTIDKKDNMNIFISSIQEDFRIDLPAEILTIPMPYKNPTQNGFKFRGTKGWLWTPEQYLSEIPVMVKYKMNFLMNCYGSLFDIEHYRWGDPECNKWWMPLPPEKKKSYENIVKECQKNNIIFCFSMNPNLFSSRPFKYGNEKDSDDLWKHYEWMQGLGVKWFNISLDDISEGINAEQQAKTVNAIFNRLKKNDSEAKMIFTPTQYWGRGENDPYIEKLANNLDKDVYIFWTGIGVVSSISTEDAIAYKNAVKHRLFIWDNYPVNDGAPTMHLGPVIKRSPDLHKVADGYMANPLCPQNEINRIPLITCADYSYNPEEYDPDRSISQAILQIAENKKQQDILKDLVELYPGFLITKNPRTDWNPLISRFTEIINMPHNRYLALIYLKHVEDIIMDLEKHFPNKFLDAQKTLKENFEEIKKMYKDNYDVAYQRKE